MKKVKASLSILILIVVFMAAIVVGQLFNLGLFKLIEPRKQNIERLIFENTKAYTHGKIQELAKLYQEYNSKDENGKKAIKAIVLMEFSDFDATRIHNYKLRKFLTNMRGY